MASCSRDFWDCSCSDAFPRYDGLPDSYPAWAGHAEQLLRNHDLWTVISEPRTAELYVADDAPAAFIAQVNTAFRILWRFGVTSAVDDRVFRYCDPILLPDTDPPTPCLPRPVWLTLFEYHCLQAPIDFAQRR